MDNVLDKLQPKITSSVNDSLFKPNTAEEVQQALFQQQPLKAPSRNEMSQMFFQKYWHIVGHLVMRLVLSILNCGSIPSSLNETCIILISKKKKKPVLIQDFILLVCVM